MTAYSNRLVADAKKIALLTAALLGLCTVAFLAGAPAAGAEKPKLEHVLGFETGNFEGWNLAGVGEVTPTVQKTTKHSGEYAAKFALTGSKAGSEISAGGKGTEAPEGVFFEKGQTVTWREWFYIPTGAMVYGESGASNAIWKFHGDGSSGTALSLELDNEAGGKGLYVNDSPNLVSPRKTFVGTAAEGAWHQFEVEFFVAEGSVKTGWYRVSLDGKPVREAREVYTLEGTSTKGYIKTGLSRGMTGTSELYVDDAEYGVSKPKLENILGFETGNFEGWNLAGVGEVTPTVQKTTKHSGEYAAKFALTGSKARSEIAVGGKGTTAPEGVWFKKGQTVLWREWFYIPTGAMVYGEKGVHNTIWQFHGEGSLGTALSLELNNETAGKGLWVNDSPNLVSPRKTFVGAVAEGAWHQFEVEFYVAEGSVKTGYYRLSLDGKPVREAREVYTMEGSSQEGYIKTGLYRGMTGTSELYVDDAEYSVF